MPQIVHVLVDKRKFAVTFVDKKPTIIKERILINEGKPWEMLVDRPRWHHNHHGVPKHSKSLYLRVINAALQEL